MKHLASFAIAAAFFAGYLWLTRPSHTVHHSEDVESPGAKAPVASRVAIPLTQVSSVLDRSSATFSDPPSTYITLDASVAELKDRISLSALRNAIGMSVFAEATEQRALDNCVGSDGLAGPQNVRFSVDVEALPMRATISNWKFEEIVDGEVPALTFAACAEQILQGKKELVPPVGAVFPVFTGRLSFMYRMGPSANP